MNEIFNTKIFIYYENICKKATYFRGFAKIACSYVLEEDINRIYFL